MFVVDMERKERLLRSGEAAEILGVDRHTIVKWIREGRIRAVRLPSGRYRIPVEAPIDLIEAYFEVRKKALREVLDHVAYSKT